MWLLIPVGLTAVAAIVSWLRARPRRLPDAADSVRGHGDYLDALVQTARSKDRGPFAGGPGDGHADDRPG